MKNHIKIFRRSLLVILLNYSIINSVSGKPAE